ncbi:4-methylaminobutanoate oxidase (formaldehyde-forming) [Shimia sp. SK013]|uniref:NAD(P)/FAD-dependent oxidoreductase n=1 Tax=Shimia sp. SK013 TaxID=1389006 RepID=UPI0006B41E0F|nr:FAD-binding oxidoreductase [Shimia sp. SK013]KPA19993.1 4-methylaminobutanoate oxidase (formaldehyde-forming) [Shimia sp. SK013]
MAAAGFASTPTKTSYDVVIIGGAIMGASSAWFLSDNKDFNGSVLVVEREPSYENCSTAHTNSCMRQQFSSPLNVKISQFAADFVKNLRTYMGGDVRVPEMDIQNYGYLYLADNVGFADVLRANQKVQLESGAETRLLSAAQIAAEYPFYNVDDVVLGSINTKDEGYWDGGGVFDWFRRSSRERGVEYVANEVVAMTKNAAGTRVDSITLKSGEVIACGQVVNASGPRAARTAKMAGIEVPVEPRKRFTWIFTAEQPLDRELPLTIDPTGVHFRQDGPKSYLAGCPADPDPAVDFDDFNMDHNRWQDHVWPIIATRIPQFEAIKVVTEWAGHYAYNTFDQNAILGAHPEVGNFVFLNGFSGHGLQQSPAMGRGTAEWLIYGGYRSLDLSPFGFERIAAGRPFVEKAVI